MKVFKAILLAIAVAVLLWRPANAGPAPGDNSSASEVAPVVIGFSPPLDEPLFYRTRRVSQAPSGNETGERIFTVRFQREGRGFRMIATQISLNGRAVRDRPLPPILIEQTFSLDADGTLIGMEDEPAYWAAMETILQGERDARERQAMLQVMRDTQVLPVRERMHWISDDFYPVIAYATMTVQDAPVEFPEVRRTVIGPIVGLLRLVPERLTDETIAFNSTWSIPPDQLELALAELTARFGRESADFGTLVHAQATRTRVELERRTGLLRQSTETQEIRTERDGVSLSQTVSETIERIAREDLESKAR